MVTPDTQLFDISTKKTRGISIKSPSKAINLQGKEL